MKKYRFHYTDASGNKTVFTGLSKNQALTLYKVFLRDMVIKGYTKVGWSVE